jgi:hypothetical protein
LPPNFWKTPPGIHGITSQELVVFIIFVYKQIYGIGWACGTYGEEERYVESFGGESRREGTPW